MDQFLPKYEIGGRLHTKMIHHLRSPQPKNNEHFRQAQEQIVLNRIILFGSPACFLRGLNKIIKTGFDYNMFNEWEKSTVTKNQREKT